MVIVRGLSFAYQLGHPIFTGFDFGIEAGERWAIVGPSGCGKTTLLYLIAGLLTPASGNIEVRGKRDGSSGGTGLILQEYGLLPWATAFENVSLGLRIRGLSKETVAEKTGQWMTALGIYALAGRYPTEISGGQRQRVAIARTLALEPNVLLMDEPFASLDALTREDLLDLTLDLWRKGQPPAMALVSHNIEEAVFWGSRLLVLGRPPNSSPLIVDNRGSGSPGYRSSLEFASVCGRLRDILAESLGRRTEPRSSARI